MKEKNFYLDAFVKHVMIVMICLMVMNKYVMMVDYVVVLKKHLLRLLLEWMIVVEEVGVVVYKLINDEMVELINNVEDDEHIVPFEDLEKERIYYLDIYIN